MFKDENKPSKQYYYNYNNIEWCWVWHVISFVWMVWFLSRCVAEGHEVVSTQNQPQDEH